MADESKVSVEDTDEKVTDETVTNDEDSLEALLNELDSDEEKSDEKEEEEIDDKQKQINDLKAQLGRVKKANEEKEEEKKEEPKKEEPKKEDKFNLNEAMAEDLLLQSNPNIKNIMPTLKAHAKKLGTDVYSLYKTDDSYKTMANSFEEKEGEDEDALNKINKPSGAQFSNKSIDNVTDEDMENMTDAQRLKVLQELEKREALN